MSLSKEKSKVLMLSEILVFFLPSRILRGSPMGRTQGFFLFAFTAMAPFSKHITQPEGVRCLERSKFTPPLN
jgi:hypothetical protein